MLTQAILGKHEGAELYTTGQGARIGGTPGKYFVVSRHQPPRQSSIEFGLRHGDLICGERSTDHSLLVQQEHHLVCLSVLLDHWQPATGIA